MLGNLFRQKTGVVGGFYIWLEPLRQLQLEGIRKANEQKEKK